MAHMFPEVFPGAWNNENPEFLVYQTLYKLPDTYTVMYSKRLDGGLFGKPECEIDFIIFNDYDVLICLEVKGGLINYNGQSSTWSQNNKLMTKSPEKQASDSCYTLIHSLNHALTNVNVEWALCFPQCSLARPNTALNIDAARILDESKLLDPISTVHELEKVIRQRYHKKGVNPRDAYNIIQQLTRSIGFVQILGIKMAKEAEQLIQVTQEQLEVLEDLKINPRILVHGAAGTGKTILAQEFAKRLLATQKKVLLLFFNKGIAKKTRYAFERNPSIQVGTFSSFAKRLIEEFMPDWWEQQKIKDDDFWRIELPLKLFDIDPAKLPKFDAIIVDEGQDFKPEWFEFLYSVLQPGDQTYYCVFLDEHQDIFHHWKHFPCQTTPARKVLIKNCRNTRAIVDYLNNVYPVKMIYFDRSPVGVPIVERVVKNAIEEQTQVIRDIRNLIDHEQVKPGEIVILLNSKKEDSCLAETKNIDKMLLTSTYERYDPRERKIYYATIDIFKGMEANVIFLILADCYSPDEIPNAIYVQGSRAKHLLYIYRRSS